MARDQLLDRVISYATEHGIAGKSLREIATGAGTSHRMLIYHFGTHAGLLTAIVDAIEAQQREVMTAIAETATSPQEIMTRLWQQVSSPELRPFVRLFFEMVPVMAARDPDSLTKPWIEAAMSTDQNADPQALRAGVAVSRGLLLDLIAGADPTEVNAAYAAFTLMWTESQ